MIAKKSLCAACVMAYKVESFTIDSMIREYDFYKDVWLSFIAEVLYCQHDVHSKHNHPFAVPGDM